MRQWFFGFAGVLLGFALGFLIYGRSGGERGSVLVALIEEVPQLRVELTKNNHIQVVDPTLLAEAVRSRKDDGSVTRSRKACQEFGAKFLILTETSNFSVNEKPIQRVAFKIIEVASGGLLWTREWVNETPKYSSIVEELTRLIR